MRQVYTLFLVLIFSLEGCTGPKMDGHIHAPTYGGVFCIVQTGEVETVDPMRILFTPDWRLASNIYEGLVGIDSTLGIRPLLAEKWQVLDGGRRILFTLRSNAYFSQRSMFPGKPRPKCDSKGCSIHV